MKVRLYFFLQINQINIGQYSQKLFVLKEGVYPVP